jgi:uncharacterized protein
VAFFYSGIFDTEKKPVNEAENLIGSRSIKICYRQVSGPVVPPAFGKQILKFDFALKRKPMKCPNCDETLVMADRNGVEIDYCPKCRGVWLDRGELDKIIERAAAYKPDTTHSGDDYRHKDDYNHKDDYRHKDDERYKRKRKGSFLGDLFDFD